MAPIDTQLTNSINPTMEELTTLQHSPTANQYSKSSDEEKGTGNAIPVSLDGATIKNDKEEAVKLTKSALELIAQYHQLGSINVLNEAVCLLRRALVLVPHGHADCSEILMHLAKAVYFRFKRLGCMADLSECISLFRDTLVLRPEGHPQRGMSLCNLAGALVENFEESGDMAALAEAIGLLRDAISLWPAGHPDSCMSLNNLAVTLRLCYLQNGKMDALTESISIHRNALALRPYGHPDRGMLLNNLAVTVMRHYQDNGNIDALVESISLNRSALALRPDGHLSRSNSLSNLAVALYTYYEYSGDVDNLAESISLYRDALALRPSGHPERSMTLSDLAAALRSHYRQSGNSAALAECLDLNREALSLRPQGNPYRGVSLNTLAEALSMHYKQSGDMDVLVECISLYHETLHIWHMGNPDRDTPLYGLCEAYCQQFDSTNDGHTLQNALKCAQELMETRPHGHPKRQDAYHLIARIRLKDSNYYGFEEALQYCKIAIADSHALPRRRLQYSVETLRSVEYATKYQLSKRLGSQQIAQILQIYISVIELLPLTANYGITNTARLRELSESGQLCRAAAMYAVSYDQLRLAVQVYEEGKAVFWAQALRLRSPALDTLPPDDKETLRSLFYQLEHDNIKFSEDIRDKADLERRAEHRRQLNMQAEELIEDIRRRPGFDRFLKIPLYEQLRHSAASGFVVVLVLNEASCFAIVIHANDTPRSIALDAIKRDAIQALCQDVAGSGMRDCEQRLPSSNYEKESTRAITIKKHQVHDPLAEMWRTIVKPVIDGLRLQKAEGRDRPRVHWCPSGELALLPLHAAGIYQTSNRLYGCAADYIVSSYTPSLSALLRARDGFAPIPRSQLHAALYAESGKHSGHVPIYQVIEEVKIASRILTSKSVVIDNDVQGASTAVSVLESAAETHILHLSCHGIQHKDPLKSYFLLKDRPLTVSDLMALDLKNAVLAYLSACYTAQGDKNQPDQAVHLAASMLFCGFRSVVGTMWSMHDKDGPKMAERFYEELLKKETIDLDDIPYALDAAVAQLRKEGAPARQWATFMHLGA